MERTAVANKIRNGFALCFNNVYNRQSQEQEWLKKWRQLPEVNQPLDILKKTSKPELIREDEKNFMMNRIYQIWLFEWRNWFRLWKNVETDKTKTSFKIRKMNKLLSCVKVSIFKCPIQIYLTLHLNLQHHLLVWIIQGF